MIFNVEGVKRSDVHVAFKRSHLMVSWSTTTTELEEDGVLVREHRTFQRAIPLPEGTQVS
jgi:HSP20 family molecular chaperone IbpA